MSMQSRLTRLFCAIEKRIARHTQRNDAINIISIHSILARLLDAPVRYLDRVTSRHHRLLDIGTAFFTHHPLLFPNGFFHEGWGDVSVYERVQSILRKETRAVEREIESEIHWSRKTCVDKEIYTQEVRFKTTMENAESLLPRNCLYAFAELVTPEKMRADRALVLLLPGTGEHGYIDRRESVALPLARNGVCSLILEGPFYGKRKPENQLGSKLRRVSDLPLLGQATITEALSLIAYFRKREEYCKFLVAGSSMGGLHAAMVASLCPHALGMVAWLAPLSAAPIFSNGLLSHSCNWKALTESVKHCPKERLAAFFAITDIRNFAPPKIPDASVFVFGTEDEYVGLNEPRVRQSLEHWPSAHVRYLKRGHISGILLERQAFQTTILEYLDRMERSISQT